MAQHDVTVELFYDSAWHDATFADKARTRDEITLTAGRADEVSTTPPAATNFTLDDRATGYTYNPRHPNSPVYGIGRNLPCRVTVDGTVRFSGEVSSWTPRRTPEFRPGTGRGDAWTETRSAGPLRRLAQGDPPALPCAQRYVFGANATKTPLAYWPMGGVNPLTANTAPMKVADITGSSSPDLSWMLDSSVPVLGEVFTSGGRDIYVRPTAPLVEDEILETDWTLRARPTTNTSAFTLSNRIGQTLFVNVIANWTTGVPTLTLTANSGTLDTATAAQAAKAWDEAPHAWRVTLSQNGADVDVTVYLDGTDIMSGTETGVTLTDGYLPGLISAGRSECVVGPIIVWVDANAASVDQPALLGYPGETTGNRFERICAEAGITATVDGDADDTPEMGAQLPDTLSNLFRIIEATDDGFIYDTPGQLGLTMRTGRSTWNQDATLDLDWDAYEVGPPSDPVIDDQQTRNDVTAARPGSAVVARAERTSGPLNVSDPADDPEGVGRYPHRVDVNPFSDLVLGDHAGWHLHRGTVDETRWPNVTVDLEATPSVDIDAVAIGDRLTISNVPTDISPDQITLVVVGWSESLPSHRRRITFNCVPESPLHIAEVEHADYSILGSDGSTVNTAFVAGTGTSLSVAIAAGYPLWSFTSTFDILVDGVRLRVTAIAGASSPQTFTVQAAPINGITKTIAAGERVDLFHKSYIGK